MKTAKVRIQDCTNNRGEYANMLLDTGAKCTYITFSKAKSLGLKLGPAQTVKLNTFGESNPSNMVVYETKLAIKQEDGSVKMINAKICKNITGPMMICRNWIL